MDEMQQAHHELDRLQSIITRHEGFMFLLRGWLLTVLGGLLAAYYTDSVQMEAMLLRIALFVVALLFLIVESRHANLVESLVERAEALENSIVEARVAGKKDGWFDGPLVSLACQRGVDRWRPRRGMTFILNEAFYVVVIVVIILGTISLPQKLSSTASKEVPTAVNR